MIEIMTILRQRLLVSLLLTVILYSFLVITCFALISGVSGRFITQSFQKRHFNFKISVSNYISKSFLALSEYSQTYLKVVCTLWFTLHASIQTVSSSFWDTRYNSTRSMGQYARSGWLVIIYNFLFLCSSRFKH